MALAMAMASPWLSAPGLAQTAMPGTMPTAERARQIVEQICRHESRVVGTAGHDAAVAEVAAMIEALPGVRVWRQEFPVLVPHTEDAHLSIEPRAGEGAQATNEGETSATVRLYPLWPSGVRLNTTPAEGLRARLMYVGEGRSEQLPAQSLRGQIAVLESSARDNWMNAVSLGAAAIVLLGSADESFQDFKPHDLWRSVETPRLYLPDGPLAERLRRGDYSPEVTLVSRCQWRESTATNLYALVKPAAPADSTTATAPARPALAIAVALDAASLVPDLCPGADNAVDVAQAVGLLERLAQNPPRGQPVLVAFLDANAIHMRGMREMLGALALTPPDKRDVTAEDARLLKEYDGYLQELRDLDAQPNPLAALGQLQYRPLHPFIKDAASLEITALDTLIQPRRLAAFRATGEEKTRLQGEIEALAEQRARLNTARTQMVAPPSRKANAQPRLAGELTALAQDLLERASRRIESQSQTAHARADAEQRRNTLRREISEALGLDPSTGRPLGFLLGLECSDTGLAAGPWLTDSFFEIVDQSNSDCLLDWLEKIDRLEGGQLWPGDLRRAVELGPRLNPEAIDSYTPASKPLLTGPALSFNMPAMTWATLDAVPARIDTPQDRAERLDWGRLAPQVEATARMVRRLADDASFRPVCPSNGTWSSIRCSVVDQAPGEPLPRLPMEGYLCTLVPGGAANGKANGIWWTAGQPGTRRLEFFRSGADGQVVFDYRTCDFKSGSGMAGEFLDAYGLADDGRIERAIDIRKTGRGVTLDVNARLHAPTAPRGQVFTCQELNVFGLVDPRFLLNLGEATILDARRGTVPQRLNHAFVNAGASCLFEPGLRWAMVMRTGLTANRLALLNVAPAEGEAVGASREAIRGFSLGEPLPAHPALMAARDFHELDRQRLVAYRRAGITSQPIEEIEARTSDLLAAADEAATRDDGAGLVRNATAALANEIRAYDAVRDVANDVVRAAVFLLLVLVPFSFALERLLYGTPHIYRQMIATSGIFLVMMAVLWAFHPAFRISSQPLIIVMAFAIIFMSLLVMSMVFMKFKTGLDEMRSERAESSGARSSGMGLAVTALKLGIANMRKRRLRTALTASTVVLITFSLLCFMSTSNFVGQREFLLHTTNAPYTGVLIRQPHYRAMPGAAPAAIRNILGEDKPLAERFWWQNGYSSTWRIHVRRADDGRVTSVRAALGLSPVEASLTRIGEVCPDWQRFAQGGGCYLPRDAAEKIDAKPGDRLVIAGRELTLVGTFDPEAFDRTVTDLDGHSLLPTDYTAMGAAERDRKIQGNWDLQILASEMRSGEGMEADMDLPHLAAADVMVVPARFLERNGLGSMYSLALGTESPDAARSLTTDLSRRFAFPIYFGSPAEVRVMATTPLLPQVPKSILIPLLIASLIIFNTMLSSIAERKREIYVYTSLGLAPFHVGVLFLAEAATYGLMGSIFGYVVGQGLATLLSRLGLLGGITLNYSGTQTIFVMALVMAVVIVSSLIPAWLAGRLATPSNEMTWTVPAPQGDTIRDVLPFTVTPATANGTIAYLLEYFEAHRDGNIGHFSTDNLRIFHSDAERSLLGLQGTVWLAPYDLGVRQDFRILMRPGVGGVAMGAENVLGLEVELRRESGQVTHWRHLNRVFLGSLRRQMLGWRNLKTERLLRYIGEAGRLRPVEEIASEERPA